MPDQYRKPYIDSSGFISLIKMETVKGVERGKIVKHILARAAQGDYPIYTSSFTLAEVNKLRPEPRQPADVSEKILAFFEHEFIKLVDVDRRIGEQANRFCQQYNLYPADAVHLACAIRAGCDVLLAWDDRFIKVNHPQISIEEPRMLGQRSLELAPEKVNE